MNDRNSEIRRACAEAFKAGALYIGFEDGQAAAYVTCRGPQVKIWRGKKAVALPAFHSAPVSLVRRYHFILW